MTWVVESPGSSFNMGFGSAALFQVPSESYWLDSITLALGNIYIGGTNNLAISIRADQSGMPTGSLLETVVMRPANLTSDHLVVTYSSSLNPVLHGGGFYWVIVEPSDLNLINAGDNSAFNWYSSGTGGNLGYHEFNFAAENWYDWQINANSLLPAFRIEGTVVPEPSPFVLLFASGAAFWFLRKRR